MSSKPIVKKVYGGGSGSGVIYGGGSGSGIVKSKPRAFDATVPPSTPPLPPSTPPVYGGGSGSGGGILSRMFNTAKRNK